MGTYISPKWTPGKHALYLLALTHEALLILDHI